MKKLLAMVAVLLVAVGCENVSVESVNRNNESSHVLHACISDETRAYFDENINTRWNEGDMITVFDGKTRNKKYLFLGKTGDNAGDFENKTTSLGTANRLDNPRYYAVYPYNANTSIHENGTLTIYWPEEQNYLAKSAGIGANIMVAATADMEDTDLYFRNVGSYLRVRLYGAGQVVKSLVLEGNNGELLNGEAEVVAANDAAPRSTMVAGGTTLTLNCGEGVAIGATEAEATEFWIVVPEVVMQNGLTLTVNGDEGSQQYVTNSTVTFARNKYNTMTRELTELKGEVVYGNDIIVATIGSATRTYLDFNGTTVYWSTNDTLGVFTAEGGANKPFVAATSEDAYSGRFRGDLNNEVPKYTYYPYSATAGSDHTALQLTLPAEQEATAYGRYDYRASNTLRSGAVGYEFDFQSVQTLIAMTINTVDSPLAGCHITSATLQALPVNEGDPKPVLTGDFTLNLETLESTFAEGGNDYGKLVWSTPHNSGESAAVGYLFINTTITAGMPYKVTIETAEGKGAVVSLLSKSTQRVNYKYNLKMTLANYTADNIEYFGIEATE